MNLTFIVIGSFLTLSSFSTVLVLASTILSSRISYREERVRARVMLDR